jgi:hypothetical protein
VTVAKSFFVQISEDSNHFTNEKRTLNSDTLLVEQKENQFTIRQIVLGTTTQKQPTKSRQKS